MEKINNLIGEKKYSEAITESLSRNMNNLTKLFIKIQGNPPLEEKKLPSWTGNHKGACPLYNSSIRDKSLSIPRVNRTIPVEEKLIRVKLLSNWSSTEYLKEYFNKMSKGNYRWDKILIVTENPDFWVIFNSPPPHSSYNPSKTVIFQMEPNMHLISGWKEWGNPDKNKFLKVFTHRTDYNNLEWNLSRDYNSLKQEKITKSKCKKISTVLSSKYFDPGHIKRINFVKYLDTKNDIHVDVFGSNKWKYKNFQGSLPQYQKDKGLFPYKYTFNCENNSIKNYVTEKLVDAILSECLIFYSGCHNLSSIINEKAFVYLELVDFEKDYQTIIKMINSGEWEKRLPYILKAKEKILNQLQFFPRLEKILLN